MGSYPFLFTKFNVSKKDKKKDNKVVTVSSLVRLAQSLAEFLVSG